MPSSLLYIMLFQLLVLREMRSLTFIVISSFQFPHGLPSFSFLTQQTHPFGGGKFCIKVEGGSQRVAKTFTTKHREDRITKSKADKIPGNRSTRTKIVPQFQKQRKWTEKVNGEAIKEKCIFGGMKIPVCCVSSSKTLLNIRRSNTAQLK